MLPLLLLPVRLLLMLAPRRSECGQSTAEYALVLLGVAAVALGLLTWAAGGKVGAFFDTIFDHLIKSVR